MWEGGAGGALGRDGVAHHRRGERRGRGVTARGPVGGVAAVGEGARRDKRAAVGESNFGRELAIERARALGSCPSVTIGRGISGKP